MSFGELSTGLFIHVLTPFVGIWAYLRLCKKMNAERIPSPPELSYFVIFFTLGGWLIVALTGLFWEVSGMFMLGVLYLVFGAPFVTAGVAISLRSRRRISVYHLRAFQISAVYAASVSIAVGVWFLICVR